MLLVTPKTDESPQGRGKEPPDKETPHIVATVSDDRIEHPSKRSPWGRR